VPDGLARLKGPDLKKKRFAEFISRIIITKILKLKKIEIKQQRK
jgi:hypothetical protein